MPLPVIVAAPALLKALLVGKLALAQYLNIVIFRRMQRTNVSRAQARTLLDEQIAKLEVCSDGSLKAEEVLGGLRELRRQLDEADLTPKEVVGAYIASFGEAIPEAKRDVQWVGSKVSGVFRSGMHRIQNATDRVLARFER